MYIYTRAGHGFCIIVRKREKQKINKEELGVRDVLSAISFRVRVFILFDVIMLLIVTELSLQFFKINYLELTSAY